MTVHSNVYQLNCSINNLLGLEPAGLPEQIAKQAIEFYLNERIKELSKQSSSCSKEDIKEQLTSDLQSYVGKGIQETLYKLNDEIQKQLKELTFEIQIRKIEYDESDNISNIGINLKVEGKQ